MSHQTTDNVPITSLATPAEQHMLFLFFPLKEGTLKKAVEHAQAAFAAPPAPAANGVKGAGEDGPDPRVVTGVHFFMFYGLPANTLPQPALPVPSFQTAKDKDLLVVVSIYDGDFFDYIQSFTTNPPIAFGLNGIVSQMDETDIVSPEDPTSAHSILKDWNPVKRTGGVATHTDDFVKLLMRYNFADPTVPAANVFPVNTPDHPKYLLGATFPGLTVGWILQNYPQANELWPLPAPKIVFQPSARPES
jgi:hypothetical protein